MRRKNRFETYKEAASRGNYDEFPMFERGVDPQLHLSRNSVPQPFFLICEQDTVIAQMSGTAKIEFRNSPANYFNLALGDFVYVPGGTPHRLVPQTESIHLRYKAEHAGLEAAAWYKGADEVGRVTWDCAKELPQEGYLRACRNVQQRYDSAQRLAGDRPRAVPLGRYRRRGERGRSLRSGARTKESRR